MLEIYNEVIRDLLVLKKSDRAGLPLHEKPGRGFHSNKNILKCSKSWSLTVDPVLALLLSYGKRFEANNNFHI